MKALTVPRPITPEMGYQKAVAFVFTPVVTKGRVRDIFPKTAREEFWTPQFTEPMGLKL